MNYEEIYEIKKKCKNLVFEQVGVYAFGVGYCTESKTYKLQIRHCELFTKDSEELVESLLKTHNCLDYEFIQMREKALYFNERAIK